MHRTPRVGPSPSLTSTRPSATWQRSRFADGNPRLTLYTDSATTAVDVRSGDVLADLPVNGLFRPQVSPTGSIAVRRLNPNQAEVIDPAAQEQIAVLDVFLNNNAQQVAFSGDERRVAIFDYAGAGRRASGTWTIRATPASMRPLRGRGCGT